MNKLCRRALCAITALLFVLCSLPAGARTETEAGGITSYAEDSNGVVEYEIKPRHSDGVTLEYSETVLRGNLHSGVFTFAETKTVTLVARFAEGWSYNDKYSVFFPSNPARRTILLNSDASIRFSFSAIAGESVAFSDLYLLGIYAAVESLPRLDITTLNDFSLIGKDNWVSANFSLTLGTKKYSSGEFSGSGYVKGRGNLSWTQPQKPYSIKLEQKTSLLDIPATKRYAIVASYSDPSLMRNLVTYKAGALLSGMDYVPKCEFVDVYFNGEYNGIYILIERPGIESTKVDIDEADESDITGGYFIEKDIAMKVDFARDMWFGCPYWANQTQDYFVLKQPEPASSELTARMLEYLEEHMKSVHNAVMGISGEDYQKYIDVDSWIDYIIIQEITKNIDGNFKTSCYLYKQSQDDRLYMTAIWDFDIAFGLTAFNNASAEHNDVEDCVGGRGPVGFIAINSSAPWFNALYHNYPDFQARFKQRYKEYRSTLIPEFFALINEQAAYLYNCTAATEEKWEKNFDPFKSGANHHYVEGNAWQLTFFVPQNVPALTEIIGKELFIDRLSWGFKASEPWRYNAPGDQYWDFPVVQGNQQSMHFAFLFNWAGQPWQTQRWSRSIIDRYYGFDTSNAYLGDEDQGQMSAWFVMAALGLFQTDGGCNAEPVYELGSPLFEKIKIDLGKHFGRGKQFIIKASNTSRENKYIQSAKLNGKKLNSFKFPAKELLKGGTLELEMGNRPNKNWGIK